MNLALYSYLAAGLAYSFFAVLLLFSWRESLQGKLIFIVMLVSACWALIAAQIALNNEAYLFPYQVFEILRYIAWYVFLLKLFAVIQSDSELPHHSPQLSYRKFVRWALPLSAGFAFLLLINEVLVVVNALPGQFVLGIVGNVILALIGLAIIEQLYRNTSPRYRWTSRYLFFAAGGVFAFDFYLYVDTLLFRSVDQELWSARGVVHVVAVPLLAIAAARNKNWSLNIFVSREIILNTTVIVSGGFYLLAMAAAGYYLREFGGDWGEIGRVVLLTLAVASLYIVLTSSQIRAKLKVFLGKHFYKNKYDYRIEWLRLTEDLNANADRKDHYKTAIKALANIVDARAGSLWMREKSGEYKNIEVWQCEWKEDMIAGNSSLVRFLEQNGFVVNVKDLRKHTEEYKDLLLPECLQQSDQTWLIVPLYGVGSLPGFVVLANPLITRSINWEDRDLLKTAAKQITSYLVIFTTSAQLAQAKQFEVFSRVSAYMVHDLKNIAAELELVAINAKKHGSNPAFIEDAFGTVDNAAGGIKRLLDQLQNRRVESEKAAQIDLSELVVDVIESKKHLLPAPRFTQIGESGLVFLEKKRFANVFAHLIENAQQATAKNGEITVTLSATDSRHVIEIKDNGHGMDENFIRHRLFKPFDTTKGNAGMGIGMYESREFARQLGGDVSAQSQPGKWTIITMQLPLLSTLKKQLNHSENG